MNRHLIQTCLLLLVFLLSAPAGWAQKERKPRQARVKGEDTIPVEDDMSREEAKELCIERAKINAIENEFGRVIFQGNSTYIENVNTGKRVETDSRIISVGDSYVKAEMLSVDEPKCDFAQDVKGNTWVTCKVRGVAREILEPPIEFIAEPLDCEEPRCKTTDFYNDERLFMHFKSPVNGFLSIYLADGDKVYLLLPGNGIDGSTYPIAADEDHILFDHAEFLLFTTKQYESDRLFVIFSKNEYDKSLIDKGQEVKHDGEVFIEPDNMPVEAFQKWLSKLRTKRTDIQVKLIDVTIKKP